MISLLPKNKSKGDLNTIFILIIFTIIKYYTIDQYEKIPYTTSLLSRDC